MKPELIESASRIVSDGQHASSRWWHNLLDGVDVLELVGELFSWAIELVLGALG